MPKPVAGVRDIVLVGSGKGGVGKLTVALNMAVALARVGRRTGVVDLDISGPSIARLAGRAPRPSSGLMAARCRAGRTGCILCRSPT